MAEASNEELKVEIAASGKLPADLKMVNTRYFAPKLKEKSSMASRHQFNCC